MSGYHVGTTFINMHKCQLGPKSCLHTAKVRAIPRADVSLCTLSCGGST